MLPVSVVIITKNEAKNIVECIHSATTITDDIIVVDAESEDETATLASRQKANVINLKWKGYGYARNTGAAAAKNDWIFSLDADERITPSLAQQLHQEFTEDKVIVYGFKRRNFFYKKVMEHGELGSDKAWRLYNRQVARWDASPVHEKLIGDFTKKYLNLFIDHYGIQTYSHYRNKRINYASLCALKYYQQGKKATYLKRAFAAAFNFFKSYFLLLGFLDGRKGLSIARLHAYYTGLKYRKLHELSKDSEAAASNNPLPGFNIHFSSSLK